MTTGGIGRRPTQHDSGESGLPISAVVAPGPLGGGGSFAIDPERAQECIRQLRAVAVDLSSTRLLMDAARFAPPGDDDVSVNMARQASTMTDRATRFIDAWQRQLTDTADGLEAQLAAYRANEDAQRRRLT